MSTNGRPMAGFMMAIRDPIVSLFALMTVFQILGLSFANFFPTYVPNLFVEKL
jgi:hypothetical protein